MGANRLETFRGLARTYLDEIDKFNVAASAVDHEIAELERLLTVKRQDYAKLVASRSETVEQLTHVRTLVRGMEDREIAERHRREANTISASRNIEDQALDF